jgi:hypothetical protein
MVFFMPGTSAQISASMILCLGAMRVYAGYKPFVKDSNDLLAETTQWQLFFTMFAALAIKVDTTNESTQDNKLFDIVICVLQFAGPVFVPLYRWCSSSKKGEDDEDDVAAVHPSRFSSALAMVNVRKVEADL